MFLALLMMIYPFAVWFGRPLVAPHWLALLLVIIVAARALASWGQPLYRWALVGAALLALATVFADSALPLKSYPVLVSAAMLAVFSLSLIRPPTVVERIARLKEPDPTPAAIAYMRRVTLVWCVFFITNGSIALATVLWASDAVWALYNGLISYLLMGLLFAAEWLVRQRARRTHHA